jgi:hypothetical protein
MGGEEIPRLILVEVHYSSLLTTRHCGESTLWRIKHGGDNACR